jgi:pimeloyl-ACP methyl ester carboxylesterase
MRAMNRRALLLAAAVLALAATPVAARPSRFSVEVVGRGPDVVLIPGLTSGRAVWRGIVGALPGYRYHLIQVGGFAGEPAGANAAGALIAPLADGIAAYIADSHLRRPAIVGHSMGGTLAMLIALRHPELAGRIMVVDMYPRPAGLFGGDATGLAQGFGHLLASRGGRRLFANAVNIFSPPGAVAGSDPDVVGRAVQELATLDLTDALPGLRAPTTVVYAVPDPAAAPVLARSFAQAYAAVRRVRLVPIAGSGHMVMIDQPARFRAALAEFLRR